MREKITILLILVIAFIFGIWNSVFNDTALAAGVPLVTSITPTAFSPGGIITIKGGNFNNSWFFSHFQKSDSGIFDVHGWAYINDSCGISWVNASIPGVSDKNIVSWSDSQMQLKVPLNAGPSCSLKIEIPTVSGGAPICEKDSCAQFCTVGTQGTCYKQVSYNTAQFCDQDVWSCQAWNALQGGSQSRTCTKTLDCPGIDTPSPAITCDQDVWSCQA